MAKKEFCHILQIQAELHQIGGLHNKEISLRITTALQLHMYVG